MEGINSLFVTNIEMPDENLPEAFLATVGAVYEDGLSLILEGQTEATTKHYKCNTSATFAAGADLRQLYRRVRCRAAGKRRERRRERSARQNQKR